MREHAVVCVERVEQGTQDTTLWGSYVQGDGVGGELAHFQHLWSAGEEVSWIQSQSKVFMPRSESLTASLTGTGSVAETTGWESIESAQD